MPASLHLHAELDSARALERLDELRTTDVPDYRRQLTRVVMREVLRRTISRHPVDTGRSRAAWSTALTQLGGEPPPGRPGRSPDAIAEGTESVNVAHSDRATETELAVTNGVSYVPLLEYGTRAQAPHHMVQRSLAETKQTLPALAPKL